MIEIVLVGPPKCLIQIYLSGNYSGRSGTFLTRILPQPFASGPSILFLGIEKNSQNFLKFALQIGKSASGAPSP